MGVGAGAGAALSVVGLAIIRLSEIGIAPRVDVDRENGRARLRGKSLEGYTGETSD
jgi:hypothetical protein